MTKRIITVLTDDIDGTPAEETVRFALDGVSYEIDLSADNASNLRDQLGRYVAAGSKVGRVGPPARTAKAANGRGRGNAIRRWCADNGVQVNPRGRISADIIARYEAAQSQAPIPATAFSAA